MSGSEGLVNVDAKLDLQTKRMVLEEGTVYSGTLNSIVRGLCRMDAHQRTAQSARGTRGGSQRVSFCAARHSLYPAMDGGLE